MDDTVHKLSPESFPYRLSEIADPPKELFVRGTLPDERRPHLCVVGSRKPTAYGKAACEKLINELANTNIVIVSGLALGIDSIAHRTALSAGLGTLAIPGSGLSDDVLYPATHVNLACDIRSSGGALLSEFPPDFKATKWSFPQRNRIMAGLSDAILVIEATDRSGTLITARLALEYDRDVLAVPGSILSPNSSGTNTLIHQGALPVRSGDDIMAELSGVEATSASDTREEAAEDASEIEIEILTLLSEPCTKDDVIARSAHAPHEVYAALSLLEIKGRVKDSGGTLMRIS